MAVALLTGVELFLLRRVQGILCGRHCSPWAYRISSGTCCSPLRRDSQAITAPTCVRRAVNWA